jgi:uncharacterized protein YbjT (DUF2867 family)
MILITGATGTNGREIVAQLSAKGVRARAMVRRREDVKLRQTLNVEFVNGDFADASSLDAALAGVERAFLLSPSSAEQVALEVNFIRAAKRTGVRHVVKFSILGAAPNSPSRLIRRHGEAEKILEDSGIAFTILRPHYFMQNLLWYIDDIKSQGVFYASLPDTYKHSHVDARDNAAVAVARPHRIRSSALRFFAGELREISQKGRTGCGRSAGTRCLRSKRHRRRLGSHKHNL